MGFGVEAEEGGRDLVGTDGGVVPVARHLPLARTGQAVRVDDEQASVKVAASTTQASPSELKFFRVRHGMGQQQVVNALIGHHKGQAVEEFEALLAERAGSAKMHHSQSGFVNQLQGHAGGQLGGGGPGPACQHIPGSQAQVFGRQQPESDQVARNLIGQQLTNAAFDAEVIELFAPIFSQGSKGLQFHGGTLRVELIEFFFGVRTG